MQVICLPSLYNSKFCRVRNQFATPRIAYLWVADASGLDSDERVVQEVQFRKIEESHVSKSNKDIISEFRISKKNLREVLKNDDRKRALA